MIAKYTDETYAEVLNLHLSGVTPRGIAEQTGIPRETVGSMLRGKWTPPSRRVRKERQKFTRPDWNRRSGYRKCYDPTPEEIALACAEIRAAWSDEEFAIRKAFNPDEPRRWTPPMWTGRKLVAA